MQEDLLHARHCPKHPGDGCRFNELGSGPDHCENLHNDQQKSNSSVSRILFPGQAGTSVIYLSRLSPDGFSDLPLPVPFAGIRRATRFRRPRNILGLSTHEVYPNLLLPEGSVVSYTAFSPLPRSPVAVLFCGTVCFRGLCIPGPFPLGSMVLCVVPTFLPGVAAGTTERTAARQR
jgi:hypothetical protein